MIVHFTVVYGLGTGWLLWLVVPMDGAVRTSAGLALVAVTTALALWVRRRATRLHSDREGIAGRLITHGGVGGESRWSRDDDEGIESSVGGGW